MKWWWATAWLMVCWTAGAQDLVIKKNFVKKSIVVTGDATTAEVLRNDLRLSGSFDVRASGEAEFLAQVTGSDCVLIQPATKTTLLAQRYSGTGRQLAHAMADDIVAKVTGQRGIAQTKIAFIYSPKRGVKELAIMDYDGHNVRMLTSDGSISGRPRWSPDSSRIVYTSYWKFFPDVLEVNLHTRARRVLANFKGVNTGAEYSPDGNHLALTLSKDGNPELYVMNATGGGFRRLTNTEATESSPTWSPDGQSIAYVSTASGTPQIWLVGRAGGEPRRLTVSPSHNTEPAWSRPPPGSDIKPMIAVTSMVGGRFQIGIYDGDRAVVPLVADGHDNQDPTWAPNGRHLVFAKTVNHRSRLYLLDVVTKEQLELPALQGDASEPAWGPWP